MRIVDILSAPWAITPEALEEIQQIYARHLRGDKIDIEQLRASTGLQLHNEPKGYTVDNGVALLPIDGVIAKKMNLFTRISGGVSSAMVAADFNAAMNDRAVEAIVLLIDSPGGTVDGTPELAAEILASRGRKPVLAFTDGMMASAAYWIGSAADSIHISSEVTLIGSIGVVAQHVDVSAAEQKKGIKTTEIYAGKYKRIASQYAPLTEEGRATIQDQVDHVYSVFVDAVARHRGTDSADVLQRMADGRLFSGSQAITAGLVDGVSTLAEVMKTALDIARVRKQPLRGAGAAAAKHQEKKMDLTQFKTDYPDEIAAIIAEEKDKAAVLVNEAVKAGAAAERQRIADVRGQLIPGHEALIETLAFDGKTTGPEAAVTIINAEKSLREGAAARIAAEANAPVPPAQPDEKPGTMSRAAWKQLPPLEQRAYVVGGGKLTD